MPHTPHEKLESLGQQSTLHHRSSHRGDRRGSLFDSPRRWCRQKYLLFSTPIFLKLMLPTDSWLRRMRLVFSAASDIHL